MKITHIKIQELQIYTPIHVHVADFEINLLYIFLKTNNHVLDAFYRNEGLSKFEILILITVVAMAREEKQQQKKKRN